MANGILLKSCEEKKKTQTQNAPFWGGGTETQWWSAKSSYSSSLLPVKTNKLYIDDSSSQRCCPSPSDCLDCKIVLRSWCPRSIKALKISIPDFFFFFPKLPMRCKTWCKMSDVRAVVKLHISTKKHNLSQNIERNGHNNRPGIDFCFQPHWICLAFTVREGWFTKSRHHRWC